MSRRLRIPQPPPSTDATLREWMRTVTDAINQLPSLSISSTTNGPSGTTGSIGDLIVDIGSSSTRLWINVAGSASAWSGLVYE